VSTSAAKCAMATASVLRGAIAVSWQAAQVVATRASDMGRRVRWMGQPQQIRNYTSWKP
jgi:hypothetical protein